MSAHGDPLDGPSQPHDRGWLRFLGALTALVLVLCVLALSPEPLAVINGWAWLLVPLGAPLAWLAVAGQDVRRLRPVLRDPAPTLPDLEQAQRVVAAGRTAAWSVGGLLGIVELVSLLGSVGNMVDPFAATAAAVSSLVPSLLADLFLFSPLAARLAVRRLGAVERARERT